MPGLNGPQMARKIREIEKEHSINDSDNRRAVIIGLTGHDSP